MTNEDTGSKAAELYRAHPGAEPPVMAEIDLSEHHEPPGSGICDVVAETAEEPAELQPPAIEPADERLRQYLQYEAEMQAGNPSVLHEGRLYRMTSVDSWLEDRSLMSDRERAELDDAVAEGVVLDREGSPMPEDAQRRMKKRLMGAYGGPSRWQTDASDEETEVRWLIPGLWHWGTIPMLGGNQKAGKSTLVTTELVPALVVPGRRFLDHFEPVSMTEEERARGVVLFNAEVHPALYEEHLRSWGWTRDSDVKVVHLAHEAGGPQSFDLSEPELVEQWADRMIYCECCDETDNWTSVTTIVDGVTAILHAAGKGTEWYGKWYAGYRRLLRLLDTPNGLPVAHSTLSGEHMMGGIEAVTDADGLWYFASVNADNATAERRFWTIPRMGPAVPRTSVRLDQEARRLRMGSRAPERSPVSKEAPAPDDLLRELFRVNEGPSGWVPASVLKEHLGRLDRVFAGLMAEEGGPIEANRLRGPQSAYRWTEDDPEPSGENQSGTGSP